jgi:hypothetical protein
MGKQDTNNIYQLLEDLGGDSKAERSVLEELMQWLPCMTLEKFVDDFRRVHDMIIEEEEEEEEEDGNS